MKKTIIFGSLLCSLAGNAMAANNLFNGVGNVAGKIGDQISNKVSKINDTLDIGEIDNYQLFDTEIYSLSKKNEQAFDAPSSVYVLLAEDIRRSGATVIPEALRLVPGLQVARIDGHKWAISARGFNAQFSNKLLILVDGRTVYNPLFSGALWDVQDYVLGDVEKIEVIRGSGGSVWGVNAVNGVINIVTKNAADTQGTYASFTIGNQDQAIAEVRYGGKTKSNDHYRVYAKQANYDGLTKLNSNVENHDGFRQSQAGFRYDIRSIADNNISIHGDLNNGKADNFFNFSQKNQSTMSTDKDSNGANLVVNWEKTISNKSSFTLQSYLNYDQFDMGVLARSSRTADVDFQHFYNLNQTHQLTWGLSYRFLQDSIKEQALKNGVIPLDYIPDKLNNQIFGTFLQDKIALVADKAYLTIGSKFNHNDFSGFEYQPSAKLTLFPARNQTAWASVSRAVKMPTRAEHGINIYNGLQNANTSFGDEEVMAYEAGYRIKPSFTTLVDVALFYNDYSKLRTFSIGSNVAQNFGEGESFGGEVTAKWQLSNNWRWEAGYDFIKINIRTANGVADNAIFPLKAEEGKAPQNQFRLRSNYNITPKIEFDNILYYVDSLPLATTSDFVGGVPSYVRLDTRVGYLVNQNLDLSVGIRNITDRRHQEFSSGTFANPTEVGRTIYFKTTVWF